MMALLIAAGAALMAGLALPRLFVGPTLYDRALAAGAVGLRVALACAALAVAAGRAGWIDAAFAFVLAALIAHAAVLKFFGARTFQTPLARAGEEE